MNNPNYPPPDQMNVSRQYNQEEGYWYTVPVAPVAASQPNLAEVLYDDNAENNKDKQKKKKSRARLYGQRAMALTAASALGFGVGHMGINFSGVTAKQIATQVTSQSLPGDLDLPAAKNNLDFWDYFGDMGESLNEIKEKIYE